MLKRDAESLRCYWEQASEDPRGLGFTGILTSEMFGFRSDLDEETLELLDKQVDLAGKEKLSQDRSDMSVDHFRPKNGVCEDEGHPGYWWLAFDRKNYRYSCTYCSSRRRDIGGGTEGGKQDHFPIIPPPPRAWCDTDPQDRAKLLDPTDDSDTKLVTFLPNGFPRPTKHDPVSIDRVTESIRLYHLDHVLLVRKRKRIGDDISQHVNNANAASAVQNEMIYRFHKTQIIKSVRANAEHSKAARVYLQAHRAHEWVGEILSWDL